MDFINLFLLLVVFFNIFLIYFLLKAQKNIANLSYLGVVFGVIIWTVAMIFFRSASQEYVDFYLRILYFSALFTASPFLYFSAVIGGRKRYYLLFSGITVLHLIFSFLVLLTDAVLIGATVQPGENVIYFGKYYFLYSLFISMFFTLGLFLLFVKIKRSGGQKKQQLITIFFGYFFASSFAMFTNMILPWLGIFDLNWLGQVLALFMTGSTVYAIIRYRFMDIRIFLRRWMVDLVAVVFVTLFGLLAVFVSPWGFPSMAEVVFRIAILIFAVLAYRHIHAFFLNIANKFFFTTLYDFEVRTKTFVRNLPAMIDLEMIVASTTRFLSTVMGVDNVAILLANRKASSTFEIHSNTGFDEKSLRKLLKRTMLKKKVAQDPEIFVLNEAQFLIDSEKTSERKKSILKEVIRALEMVDAYVLVPIIINDQLIGMIFLSEKITKDAYTKEDIELLLNIARQSSVPIDNAFLYQEVQDFSENLQDKVDEQTKEIRDLYEVKSNFLTVASHQLRTPTSIIRGMLSILTEEDLPQEKQKEMIDAAYKSSSTLERVINDILIAAEIDSDKFEVRPEKVDIIPIISSVVDDLSLKAEKTHVRLEMKNPRWKKALVLADDTKIDQVFYNLIDNAISYSPKGEIVVSLGKEKKRGSEYFVFTCKDDGVGMSKEDMKNIGEKFYRSDNVFSIRPNGTGLGVFIVNQIVKASKGELSFDSKGIGKGSVFKVYLKAVSTRKKKAK